MHPPLILHPLRMMKCARLTLKSELPKERNTTYSIHITHMRVSLYADDAIMFSVSRPDTRYEGDEVGRLDGWTQRVGGRERGAEWFSAGQSDK